MQKTILQVPIDKTLRDQASKIASSEGFSSLQEIIRLFLHKLAYKELKFSFEEPSVTLTPRAARRYDKMIRDVESGRVKTKSFTSVDDLVKDLRS